jgi:hypothetical protein
MTNEMTVEFNSKFQKDNDEFIINDTKIMITPKLDKDYWIFRVRLHEDQSVIAFPKFSTIGIGFAIEESDWNTNLPASINAESICDHIWENHKYESITKEMVVNAIKMLQPHCKRFLKAKKKN